MSGVSRRLLWAATCLAALCVAAAQTGNSSTPPNVTEPSPATSTPVPTTLTPTVLPGGRPPHATDPVGPAQHGRPARVPRPDGWGAEATGELGRGADPAAPALPAEAPSPGAWGRRAAARDGDVARFRGGS